MESQGTQIYNCALSVCISAPEVMGIWCNSLWGRPPAQATMQTLQASNAEPCNRILRQLSQGTDRKTLPYPFQLRQPQMHARKPRGIITREKRRTWVCWSTGCRVDARRSTTTAASAAPAAQLIERPYCFKVNCSPIFISEFPAQKWHLPFLPDRVLA